MIPKKSHRNRFTSDRFLGWIRKQPCCICLALGKEQTTRTCASHMISRKWADGSDGTCLPVCIEDDKQSTRAAREAVEASGVNVEQMQEYAWIRFAREECRVRLIECTLLQFEELLIARGMGARDDKSKRKNRRPRVGKPKNRKLKRTVRKRAPKEVLS